MRKILASHLEFEGYKVVAAGDGQTGLDAAHKHKPSLILLDVALPGDLNGFEVGQTLQKSLDDKLTGLASGGVDYLPKPFTMAELKARVDAILRHDAAERRRAQAVMEEYRKNLSQNMSHELLTPMSKLRISLDLLTHEVSQTNQPYLQEILNYAQIGAQELQEIIEDLVLMNILSNNDLLGLEQQPISLAAQVVITVDHLRTRYRAKNLNFEIDIPDDLFFYMDGDHAQHIFKHLLDNACKFSLQAGTIRIFGENTDNTVRLFEKFFQIDMSTTRSQDGLGIGLYIARKIAQYYQGDVTLIESSPDNGSTFCVWQSL